MKHELVSVVLLLWWFFLQVEVWRIEDKQMLMQNIVVVRAIGYTYTVY